MNDLTIRTATPKDVAIVMDHRRKMFLDIGYTDENALAAMEESAEPFFKNGLANGSYHAWFVENGEKRVVAGGGVIVLKYPASVREPHPTRATIVNMYTEREYRRRGLAKTLMETMIEWCRKEGFRAISLHASPDGRPLYESLGFLPTNEMRLMLKESKK
jgi:GNAT superfamily N-acetyltransferase